MADDIRRLSEELARDPSSLRVRAARRGAAPRRASSRSRSRSRCADSSGIRTHADAHDLVARIRVDRGDCERAFDEWDMVLRLAPGHVGAMKGIGYRLLPAGRLAEAEAHLSTAATHDRGDSSMRRRCAWCDDCCGTRTCAERQRHTGPCAAARRATAAWTRSRACSSPTSWARRADGAAARPEGSCWRSLPRRRRRGRGAGGRRRAHGVRDEALRAMRHLDLGTGGRSCSRRTSRSSHGARARRVDGARRRRDARCRSASCAACSIAACSAQPRGSRRSHERIPFKACCRCSFASAACTEPRRHGARRHHRRCERAGGDPGEVVAALAASLYRKARLCSAAAGLGTVSFLQLDAERGHICAVGRVGSSSCVAEPRAHVRPHSRGAADRVAERLA